MASCYSRADQTYYRTNPKDDRVLEWCTSPSANSLWQTAYTFSGPIQALDIDDATGRPVAIVSDYGTLKTYIGSGAHSWGIIHYSSGERIRAVYRI